MVRQKTISLAIMLAVIAVGACSRKVGDSTVFTAENFRLVGELPAGWIIDSNNKYLTMILFPDFIENECPRVTLASVERPITADTASDWHRIDSRPVPGRENRVGPLRQTSVAGATAWTYEETAIQYPERLHLAAGQKQPKPVRVKTITYLTTVSGVNVQIEASAPDVIFDKYAKDLDRIISSLKPAVPK